ncbi:hypothetical protein [Saccharopolyspora spinosa]|uniref:hypothetical protein n=1 Tax=Saccharopolyspora spinosa TaxID=60894 RepID=UPI0011D29317|nr:hypothetical protein [Saccharopolyspora spinosa]
MPDNDEPRLGKRLDLVMAALTHCRERNAAEYRAPLAQAALPGARHIATGSASSVVGAVLGRRCVRLVGSADRPIDMP